MDVRAVVHEQRVPSLSPLYMDGHCASCRLLLCSPVNAGAAPYCAIGIAATVASEKNVSV